MKILKFKKHKKDEYKLYLEDDEVIIHEELILKYRLLLKKEIEQVELNEIIKENIYYQIYSKVLKLVSKKLKSEFEIKQFLEKNGLSNEDIDKMIMKLKENNIINDDYFAKAFINDKMNLNNLGRNKIKKELENYKIDEKTILENIDNIDENIEIEKLKKLIDKKIRTNKKYFGNILKQKIIIDIVNKGYDKHNIVDILNAYDLEINDIDKIKEEAIKIYDKYSKKYKDNELKNKIKTELYKKGLLNSEINIDELV